jgi:hypothetical protein
MSAEGGERLAEPVAARADPATGIEAVPAPPTCPYLRRMTDEGRLGEPAAATDPAHRCAAVPDPAPLSDRQQAIVCLTPSYLECPRFVRATLVVPPSRVRTGTRRGPTATIAASLILAISAIASVGYVVANGGITMPVAAVTPSPSPTDVAVASPSIEASPAVVSPGPSSPPSPAMSPSVAPSPDPSLAPSPSPSRQPSPSPSAVPSPSPTSDRYALLEPCPDRPDCFIYTVRPGDNFTSIGLYFGVPFETLLSMNPHVTDPATIQAGTRLRMPPPTR